ncbi:apolipoprotein N-acyltransferase, partial [Ralstonia pseudosolanacearum]
MRALFSSPAADTAGQQEALAVPLARLRFAAPLAALLGVMHTLAFAPNRWWWLQILSLAGLAALVRQ